MAEDAPPTELDVLTEIRDLLAKRDAEGHRSVVRRLVGREPLVVLGVPVTSGFGRARVCARRGV